MTRKPYTYITLSLRPEETARLSVAFHTGRLKVSNSVVEDTRPYLTLNSPEADVSIGTQGGGPVSDADLSLARELFAAAARYLADCERLHADHTANQDDAPASPTSATEAA